ncbi:MAG TPA: MarR family transcriptional regulator [Blastococcus sp.]|nr:MarR family transcriptional regulator [Blastococcus sp.]
MEIPVAGTDFRGIQGHSGYLLRQAWYAFSTAMENALRQHGLTGAQYAVLSVLARRPGLSGADLARACNTTPQAMNGVLATLDRERLVGRTAHPTHGRILQVNLTAAGRRRLDRATPAVRALEGTVEAELSSEQLVVVKGWLVTVAQRLDRTGGAFPP